jgi:hypothetical protein
MSQVSFPSVELVVDVLTLFHIGEVHYEPYVTEQARQEVSRISARQKELSKQGVPGLEAVRQAKIEWLLGHMPAQRVPHVQFQLIDQKDPERHAYLFESLAAPTLGEFLTLFDEHGKVILEGRVARIERSLVAGDDTQTVTAFVDQY